MALSLQRYTFSDFSTGLNRIMKERSEKERAKSTELTINIGENLPENVIVEILSWLSVKDLLQFKSVCKLWYSIISAPDFAAKHLKNYYNNNDTDNNTSCLLVQYYVSQAEVQVFEFLVDDETSTILTDEVLYEMPMYGCKICGPCHGIFYLFDYTVLGNVVRVLWNPTLSELKLLPSLIVKPYLPSDLTYANNEVYGFGYDSATEDYKVVVVRGYRNKSYGDDIYSDESEVMHPLSVFVYSLNTDSWSYCGDLSKKYHLNDNTCYIVVNGCFYWLGSWEEVENSEVIISFDMGRNAIQEIQIPKYEQSYNKTLAIYNDSLALLAVHEEEKRLEIWTLTTDGFFWTKKFTVGTFSEVTHAVGHLKKNKIILECRTNGLVLCDPETEEFEVLEFKKNTWCVGFYVYRESLVFVKGSETDALKVQKM